MGEDPGGGGGGGGGRWAEGFRELGLEGSIMAVEAVGWEYGQVL